MENYYTVNEVALMTMLSTRTIRKYICNGMLKGEKIENKWRFSEMEISHFMEIRSIKNNIETKQNSLVYDFLKIKDKKIASTCVIYDCPIVDKIEEQHLLQTMLALINNGNYDCSLKFSYQEYPRKKVVRFILLGPAVDILSLLNEFERKKE